MSQYDFDGSQEGDWDENENVAWNESDWQEYLRKSDKEISRFISAYNKSRNEPDRLEATAKLMDWGKDEWSCIDDFDLDEEQLREIRPVPLEDLQKMDPYTVHKHPLYIASCGFFSFLRSSWEHMMRHNRKQPKPELSWSYCASLADSERHFILAANCLDLGDYLLTICHLKRAHAALNESMRLNRLFSHHSEKIFTEYLIESDVRMHDLREICLRVLHDCRR
jgi:hypothetical protein